MKIFIVSRGYPTEKYKMQGLFELDQAIALKKAGHEVVFLALDLRIKNDWKKIGYHVFKLNGVDICNINFPLGKINNKFKEKISIAKMNKLYKKAIKEFGVPDVVHGHFTDVGYLIAKIKDNYGFKLVVTEHSSHITKDVIDVVNQKMGEYTYEKADRVIAVSKSLKNTIKEKFDIDSVYIPNIVDTSLFEYKPLDKGKNSFDFVCTGNLNKGKRMDLLIAAFASSFSKNDNVTLTIFGSGEQQSFLEDLIKTLKIQDRVTLMGMCSRETISKKLQTSECFVLPSASETFGVAYVEAMACGVPVIATKCGGPESFIDGTNGVMINVDDMDQLVDAMIFMYENAHKYDRINIANETKSMFCGETIAKHIENVYGDII